MAKFKGKKGDFCIDVANLCYVVEPAVGGLWSTITVFFLGGQAQFEVEGTMETVYRALREDKLPGPRIL